MLVQILSFSFVFVYMNCIILTMESLSFPLQVSSEETQYIRTVDNLIASRLSLKVQLQAIHFVAAGVGSSNSHMMNAMGPGGGNPATYATNTGGSGASGGALLLRCTAQIGDLYQEYKEIELGTPQKDPIPARGK